MNATLSVSELIEKIPVLSAGDRLLINGDIYTARDAAHQRLAELIREERPLPFKLQGAVIYYCGPAPAKPGSVIGPCGPTTSSRMDAFTPLLLSRGVKATIGKGPRSPEVVAALKENRAVYLAATGGVAALMARMIRSAEVVAFGDLGPEAVFRLKVVDFPVIVAVDMHGNDVYAAGKA